MTRREAFPLPGDGNYRPRYGRVMGAALIAVALCCVVLIASVWR